MTIHFPRGSEWRKWDLHVHTPSSHLNQQFGNQWDLYIEKLASSDISVFGITNYFCFADSELEKIRGNLQQRNINKTVLGNLEFRISQPNKDNEFINIHVIFSERLTSQKINSVISRLTLKNTTDADGERKVYCSENDIRDAGLSFENVIVDFETLTDLLKANLDQSDYLIACCSGYGTLRPARGEGRGAALAKELEKRCDIVLGTIKDREFFLDKTRYEGAPQKPVVAGCDAHKFEDLFSRYCWIKAHPNFEGLLQVLFEPEARISLEDKSPLSAFPKPFFSNLSFNGNLIPNESLQFQAGEVPLNLGLITLIGGRGTGKSILLDCLYQRLHATKSSDPKRLSQLMPQSFSVEFTKQDGNEKTTFAEGSQEALAYLHVRQGDIRQFAESPEILSGEIKRLLGISGPEGQDALGLDMSAILGQIIESKKWLSLQDEEGNHTNSIAYNEAIVKVFTQRIETITSKDNRDLVEIFNKNAAEIAQIDGASASLTGLEQKLIQYQLNTDREIATVNAVLEKHGVLIPNIDFSSQIQKLIEGKTKLTAARNELIAKNEGIRVQLKDKGIEQDPAGLLDKVSEFQKQISDANQKISHARSREATLEELTNRRTQVALALVETITTSKVAVDKAFQQLRTGKEGWTAPQTGLVKQLLADVTISGEVTFNESAFYEGLLQVLNGRKFRATNELTQISRVKSKIRVSTFEDYCRLLSNEKLILGEDEKYIDIDTFSEQADFFLPYEKYSFLDYLFLPEHQQNYLSVRAQIKYKGKDPEKLSVGQRGTFYVCMKLATDPFGSPFVFDQPEDDLDNEFIVKELVPLFRTIKNYRQIIIATHNANLVVNADAEQIILASNENECLHYISGALEDKEIRIAVCNVLEGGEEAFKKRESKYGLS